MKQINKKVVFLILTLILIIPMFSGQGVNEVNAIESIRLNTAEKVMNVGDTYSLSVRNVTNEVVTWYSENPDIATVGKNGVVTAVNKGNTNIIASVIQNNSTNRKQFICEIGVKTSDFLPETPSNYSYLVGKDIFAGNYVVFSDQTSSLGAYWEIQNINGSKIIDNEFTREAAIITLEQSQRLIVHRGYVVPIVNVSNGMLQLNHLSESNLSQMLFQQ